MASTLPLTDGRRKPKWQGVSIVCETCGQSVKVPPSARHKRFCSLRCYTKIGPMNPKWRGGVTLCDERPFVYAPGHPNATHGGTHVAEHRLVMSELIGRPLSPLDVVHHINGNKTDNRPENLALTTHAEHIKIHYPYMNERRKLSPRQGPVGTQVGSSKLTEAQVRDIRARSSEDADADIAVEFGVSRRNVSFIRSGRTWTWLR